MANDFIWERSSDLDPYDREERCRKTLRTLTKAIIMRFLAGALLLLAVLKAGTQPAAMGLAVFALILILSGTIPLLREYRKQRSILKDCLRQQEDSQ